MVDAHVWHWSIILMGGGGGGGGGGQSVCRVIGGELYEPTVDKENQEILERDDMADLLHDIHEFA